MVWSFLFFCWLEPIYMQVSGYTCWYQFKFSEKVREQQMLLSFLFMDIHSCHIRFAVALHHAEKLPAVALIETGVVGDQIGR